MACCVCDRRDMENKKSENEKEEPARFNETVKRAQKALKSENLRSFKEIFKGEDRIYLLDDFDLFGNTAINVAARFHNPQLLKDLLEMLPDEESMWKALRRKNREGNTLLHEVALQEEVAMTDIVLEFERKAAPPLSEVEEEEDDVSKDEKGLPLLEIKNEEGETPLFRAAKFGKLKMLKHLANILREAGRDMKVHCRSHGNFNILDASVKGQFFDVAVWIMREMDGEILASEENKEGPTCLQLLSRMPQAFRSHDSMGCCESLIYYLLPEDGHDIEGSDSYESYNYRQNRDEESSQRDDDTRPPTADSNQIAGLSRMNLAFWKYVAKVSIKIKKLWNTKNKQKLAKRLAEKLVVIDCSWQKYNNATTETVLELPPVLYNVPQRKIKMERKEKWEEKKEYPNGKQESPYYKYTPLLVAASNGIVEIVESFLREHPACVNYMNKEGENILHIAVRHRRLKIFELLKKHPEFKALTPQISKEGYTILHQVARMDFYRPYQLPGAAFQLQSELEWYKRVEAEIRTDYIMHCAKDDLTAGDLLDIEHDEMLRDAQNWTKGTAQSCSVVAVLVATVVFTAAYAIPGGNEGGTPVLLRSPLFIFFTVMDVVALTLSLASVVMFLSVLTSPFELWDFHKALPRRLQIGFLFMFFSLIATMLAFTATILLIIKLEWKDWTSSLVYSAAFFPVTIFALFQFPLYNNFWSLLNKTYEKVKKVVAPIYRAIIYSFGIERKKIYS